MRRYLLKEEEREAIKRYLEATPRKAMSAMVKQKRQRVGLVDFDEMRRDIALMEQLRSLDIPTKTA